MLYYCKRFAKINVLNKKTSAFIKKKTVNNIFMR